MCGRTSLFVPQSVLEDRFNATAVDPITPRYNIAPGDDLASIANETPEEIRLRGWGLIPHWVDDPAEWPEPINARAETVSEKPAFRDAFHHRRCLVLADGFYEWGGERGHKQPYRITRPDEEPFAMAGLWEEWEANGTERETLTIITTDANEAIAPIHDRMPVILEPDEEALWLNDADEGELRTLLDPLPADLTTVFPISTAVNDPANDRPEVIEPVDRGTQSGLSEFG